MKIKNSSIVTFLLFIVLVLIGLSYEAYPLTASVSRAEDINLNTGEAQLIGESTFSNDEIEMLGNHDQIIKEGIEPSEGILPDAVNIVLYPEEDNKQSIEDMEISTVPPSSLTIFSETFEGAFPGSNWTIYGNPSWDDTSYDKYSGSWSGWCADTTQSPANGYVNNMNAWMVYGPFSLSDATNASVDFYYRNKSETGYDYFQWMASTNGVNYYGWQISGNQDSWRSQTFDLTSVPTLGDLTGQNQVWIAFRFISDSLITDKGAYIDNIVIQKSVDPVDFAAVDVYPADPADVFTPLTTVTEGQQIKIVYKYTYTGPVPSATHTSRVQLDSDSPCNWTGTLPSAGNWYLSCPTITATAGDHRIRGWADVNNNIAESNESNNNRDENPSFSVAPDVAPDIFISPTSLEFNQSSSSAQGNFSDNEGSKIDVVPENEPDDDLDKVIADGESITGILHVIWGDPPPGSGQSPIQRLILTDDQGNSIPLAIDEKLLKQVGGIRAIERKRVTIRGQWVAEPSESETTVFEVESIQVVGLGARPTTAEGVFALSGSQPWATILCRFSDSTGVTPHPATWFDTLMGSSNPGMDHYWQELSYGNIDMNGSTVEGWYNLPDPRASYLVGDLIDWGKAAADCSDVADADVYFPNFVGINFMFNENIGCCAWGGGDILTIDGETKFYSMTWMPPWGYEAHGVLAQEMGHGFGLPHSSGPYSTPYDSLWDPMSDGFGSCSALDPDYGCIGVHTISYHKDLLGWIPASRTADVTPSPGASGVPQAASQTITIERLGQPTNSTDYLMAKIPISGLSTQFYTVEARRTAGGYDANIPGDAIVIHKVDTTLSDRNAQVVDATNNGDPNDAGAMWTVGETFTDTANGISVSVDSETTTGFVVTISGDGKTFTIYNDGSGTLTITNMEACESWMTLSMQSPPLFSVGPGNSQNITVTVDWDDPVLGSGDSCTIQVYSNDPDENPYPGGVTVTAIPSYTDPYADINSNGSDGPVVISQGDNLTVDVALDPGSYDGNNADWWILLFYYNSGTGLWEPIPLASFQAPLFDLPVTEILNTTGIPPGWFIFLFGVDMNPNGLLDIDDFYYDFVGVIVDTSFDFTMYGEKDREGFKEFIEKAIIWDDISGLNLSGLSKKIDEAALDEKTKKRLLKFAEKGHKIKAKLLKKRKKK